MFHALWTLHFMPHRRFPLNQGHFVLAKVRSAHKTLDVYFKEHFIISGRGLSLIYCKPNQGRSQNFQRGGGPADTNNYDRFDAPIALNTREV